MNEMFNDIQGTKWYNRYTGECVIIKEVIMDEKGMMTYVIEDKDGIRKTVNAELLNDYIQSEEPLIIPPKINTTPINLRNLGDNTLFTPFNVTGIGDDTMLNNIVVETYTNFSEQPKHININTVHNQTHNYDIIKRALKKTSKPSVDNRYTWIKFPKREIEMLHEIMDVSIDEIKDYLTSEEYITECIGDIRNEIKDFIVSMINYNNGTIEVKEKNEDDTNHYEESKKDYSDYSDSDVKQKPLL